MGFSPSISILDLPGFELNNENSLETLTKNYFNERLQQLYMKNVFFKEFQEYFDEGLGDQLNFFPFEDNSKIINMCHGLFHLNNVFTLKRQNDQDLLKEYHKTNSDKKNYIQPQVEKNIFIIVHTMKNVNYNIDNFIRKNRFHIQPQLHEAFKSSSNSIIASIFKNKKQNLQYNKKIDFKSQKAKSNILKLSPEEKQLIQCEYHCGKILHCTTNLLKADVIDIDDCCEEAKQEQVDKKDDESKTHFIHCIKSNNYGEEMLFDKSFVLQQLKHLAVSDYITFYSNRKQFLFQRNEMLTYEEFVKRYQSLHPNLNITRATFKSLKTNPANFRDLSIQIIDRNLSWGLGDDANYFYMAGKTKLYVREATLEYLDHMIKVKEEQLSHLGHAILKKYRVAKAARKLHKNYMIFNHIA